MVIPTLYIGIPHINLSTYTTISEQDYKDKEEKSERKIEELLCLKTFTGIMQLVNVHKQTDVFLCLKLISYLVYSIHLSLCVNLAGPCAPNLEMFLCKPAERKLFKLHSIKSRDIF